jgi:hypothetical protein
MDYKIKRLLFCWEWRVGALGWGLAFTRAGAQRSVLVAISRFELGM